MLQRLLLFAFLALFAVVPVLAQDGSRTVSGTVIDGSTGEPLPGASILIQGTQSGTSTDVEGNYELTVSGPDVVLRFTFVGYLPVEETVGDRDVIDVALSPDTRKLDEVLVVGYGSTIQRELTGNISRVSSADIENTPVTSVEEALQGRSAGVFITRNNGKLGQGIDVQVRGIASISADAEPLYVVDGIPITTTNLSSNGAATDPLADLNFNDIESIEILKDASAAAIYGARASNGVVLITTKSGQSGKTQFSVNTQVGTAGPTNKVDFLNAEQYVELYTEAAENSGLSGFLEGRLDLYSRGLYDDVDLQNFNFNWQDQAFNESAMSYQIDVSANGGNEDTQFYVSGAYLNEEGTLINNTLERISGRLNLQHNIREWMQIGGRLSLGQTLNNRLSNDNAFSTPIQLVAQPPIQPIFEPEEEPLANGEYVPSDELNRTTLYFNSLLYEGNVRYETRVFRSIGNTFLELTPIQGLTLRTEFGIDLLDQNEDINFNSQVAANTGAAAGAGDNTWDRIINYTTNTFATYSDAALGNRLQFDGTVGTSYQASRTNSSFVSAESFPSDEFTQINSAAILTNGGGSLTQFRFLSYFGRTNLKFDDRYLFTLSGRIDGSSRFGENNKYGFFPAVSGGVILTSFDALDDIDLLSFLKLRASAGVTGNAGISNFASRGLYTAGRYTTIATIQPAQLPNPDLKWERTTQYNFGIDYGFWNDRINGSIDAYVKNTDDLLLNVQIPSTSGFTSFTDNVGSLRNRGIEVALNADIIDGRRFDWSTGFNIGANQNEVTDLAGIVVQGGIINRAFEGEPIGAFFGLEYAGVDSETGDALYFVNEQDENGNIVDPDATTAIPNQANRVVLGSPLPDFTGGFTNEFTYGNFDLNIFFQFVYGNEIYDGGGNFRSSNATFLDNQTVDQLDRWQENGDVTDVPQARLFGFNGTADSDRYLYDGSYLRLKNLTFGYSLPQATAERLRLDRARIYFTGINLLTFTKYPLWDPEVNADYLADDSNLALGNDFYSAPQARKFTLGLQFAF